MIFTSEYESVEVGGATLPDLVLEAAAAAGERPALIDGASGEVIGYSQLAREIDEVATGLLARGFREGGVLALQAPNVPRWASVALGAMAVGGCVTGVHPAATDGELARQLQDAGATMLVTAHSLDELITGEAPRSGRTRASDDALPALLPYSSGTTGLPKGVVLTHRNLVASVRQMDRGLRLSERDVLPAVAPFCHVMGSGSSSGTGRRSWPSHRPSRRPWPPTRSSSATTSRRSS
jgi:long-subunit acyl-CoA synthetase (AMP-forming)